MRPGPGERGGSGPASPWRTPGRPAPPGSGRRSTWPRSWPCGAPPSGPKAPWGGPGRGSGSGRGPSPPPRPGRPPGPRGPPGRGPRWRRPPPGGGQTGRCSARRRPGPVQSPSGPGRKELPKLPVQVPQAPPPPTPPGPLPGVQEGVPREEAVIARVRPVVGLQQGLHLRQEGQGPLQALLPPRRGGEGKGVHLVPGVEVPRPRVDQDQGGGQGVDPLLHLGPGKVHVHHQPQDGVGVVPHLDVHPLQAFSRLRILTPWVGSSVA